MDVMKTYIYGLVDPETTEIRYIGKTIRPKERLQNHMNEVSNCHRSNWLQSLKRKGLKAEMVIRIVTGKQVHICMSSLHP